MQPLPDTSRAAKADKAKAREVTRDGAKQPSSVTSKIRSLLVGASVVVIVLGTFKLAMNLLDAGGAPPMPAMEKSSEQPSTLTPADSGARAPAPEQLVPAPSLTSPTPIGKQSQNNSAPATDADRVRRNSASTGRRCPRHHRRNSERSAIGRKSRW